MKAMEWGEMPHNRLIIRKAFNIWLPQIIFHVLCMPVNINFTIVHEDWWLTWNYLFIVALFEDVILIYIGFIWEWFTMGLFEGVIWFILGLFENDLRWVYLRVLFDLYWVYLRMIYDGFIWGCYLIYWVYLRMIYDGFIWGCYLVYVVYLRMFLGLYWIYLRILFDLCWILFEDVIWFTWRSWWIVICHRSLIIF